MAQERKIDFRIAAYIIALERISVAYAERGIFPVTRTRPAKPAQPLGGTLLRSDAPVF